MPRGEACRDVSDRREGRLERPVAPKRSTASDSGAASSSCAGIGHSTAAAVATAPVALLRASDFEAAASMLTGESPESKQPTDMIIADTQMNDEAQERNMRRTPLDHKIQKMRESLLQKLHVYLPKNSMLLPNRLENLLG